jgi:L-alanine-DL-glutamate epimerase-like enolase superfamily enzyme
MQIKAVEFYILEGEPVVRQVSSRGRGTIDRVPGNLSGLNTHSAGFRSTKGDAVVSYVDDHPSPTYRAVLRLVTDGDLHPYADYATGFYAGDLEWKAKEFMAIIAPMLVGVDPFDREYVWQKLWYAQRFFYTGRGLVDTVDNMLWDFAARHARMPLFKLLGACREKVPAYGLIHGDTIDELVADALREKEQGFVGVKDHSYRGVKDNIEMARQLRAALGDDFLLMHDPVESYDYDEAVEVGRALEGLHYRWMEEPLQDYDLMGLKKLSDRLDLPILAMEWIGYIGGQPFNASPFVAMQAVDIIRQRGVGITGQIKLAHLAESFGMQVHGGNPHVILAIRNDPLFEAYMGLTPRPAEEDLTTRGALVVENGYMTVAYNDRVPDEPDWDAYAREAVAVVK